MFTGIVEAIGSVAKLQQLGSDWRLTIDSGKLDLSDVVLGDSIAVNGCCLTVVEMQKNLFGADVSNESMRCTALGQFKGGTPVNLEKAMLASGRLGGHIVSGHVDGVGNLIESSADGASVRLVYEAPKEIAKYIADKGSICIDGTSLTVNEVSGLKFTVNVIPHTQTETIIGDYKVGQSVNLEVDLIARYLERLLQGTDSSEEGLNKEFLTKHGFG
ncbi:MAG: riboflavin synthase [Gammaproteobacteria bacterium]|jgi:riboflavin synthase|nr:riboflavin synthase [Gammaproteobacteria bacterium]|tara:strand:+ start:802 stop:1449 length:648 start_codon:yes stop_codon:yes gene_type:complete